MRNLLKLFLMIAGIVFLASCTQEETNLVNLQEGNKASFFSTIGAPTATRAAGTNWDANDAIGIYAMKAGQTLSAEGIHDGKANIKYATSASGATGKFTVVTAEEAIYLPGDGSKIDFISYYPHTISITADYKLPINVSNQATPGNIDVLYAKATGADKNNAAVGLTFNHKLAQVIVSMNTAEAIVDLQGATVSMSGVIVDGTLNLVDGTVAAGTQTGTINGVMEYDATLKTASAAVILVPGQAMENITVNITLKDGKKYSWKPAAQTLVSGSSYTYTLNVKSGSVASDPSGTINPWNPGTGGSGDVNPITETTATVSGEIAATANSTATLSVTTATDMGWTVISNQTWLTATPATGTGNANVTLTATENTTTAVRTAIVTVTPATGDPITVNVTQAAGTAVTPIFSADVTSLSFVATGENKTVKLSANVAWTATSSQTWLTLAPASGSADTDIVATAAANTTTTERTATVTIKADGQTNIVVNVTQVADAGTPIVATDLFISEYVEGSSNNKYIEIFNGTGADVDLSDYRLLLFANGSATATNTNVLSGTLASGSTIVYKNSSAQIYTGVAAIASATAFSGDDAIALEKISTASYVDIFGRIGEDPGAAWISDTYTTVNKTLRRKSTVRGGVTVNPADGTGFATLSTEWDMYDIDTVDGLGSHTMN
ncbi:MAG: fimbrillin family protein [Bacteroidia bacterium]|nr:fimbrillin family protein [Bacteroidia bacterium]